MPRNPSNARTTHRTNPPVRIPNLASTCRILRDGLGLTRDEARRRHGVSGSYLSDIERGIHLPSIETLEKIISGYGLAPPLAKHLRELHAPAHELRPTLHLRNRLVTDTTAVHHLHGLEKREVLAAYVDPLSNVVACNESFRTALPGIDKSESIPIWIYSGAGQTHIIDSIRENAYTVAHLRASMGRYRTSDQARNLIRQLGNNTEFQRHWNAGIRVAYGRNTSNPLHLRNPTTGELTSYTITVSPVTQFPNVLLLTALPITYSGPSISSNT